MNLQRGLCGFIASVFLFMILCTGSAHCEEAKKDRRSIFWLSDRDLFLPITAIEWGAPDRFSFTSRLIHRLDSEREGRDWFSSVSLMVSPGISGGRAGLGYMLLWDPKSSTDFGIFSEVRAVYLRTWGDPMYAPLTDENYVGAEASIGLGFLLKVGGGYYWLISPHDNKEDDSFIGFHVGVGL